MTRSESIKDSLERNARLVVAVILSIGAVTAVSTSVAGGTTGSPTDDPVPAEAELTAIVSPPSEIVPGTSFDLVIDITNVGTGAAENVMVIIPNMHTSMLDVPGLDFEVCEDVDGRTVCTSSSCGLLGGDLVCTISACEFVETLVCTDASIASGATVRLVADLAVHPNYRLPTLQIAAATTTWTTVGAGAASSLSADPDDPVSAAKADLTMSVDAPDTVQAGATFDVVVLVEANVGSAYAYDVVVTLPVPAGTTLVSVEDSFGACVLTGPAADIVECRMDEFEPVGFADWTFSFAVSADEDRDRLPIGAATVTASTPDPDETNNTDDPPDPVIELSVDPIVDDETDPPAIELPATR